MANSYYEILGIDKNSSKDEIKRAYRKLAQKYHPDKGVNGDEQKFREINEAYHVLADDNKRAQYDQFGQTFESSARGGQAGGFGGFSGFSDFARGFDFGDFSAGGGSAFGGDFGDIFSDIFGAPRQSRRQRGVDLETALEIDFLESVFGAEKEIALNKKDRCEKCSGSGAERGSGTKVCPTCHGQGQIVQHKRTVLGSFQRYETCPTCDGRGKVPEKICADCGGSGVRQREKTIKINIPSGIESGQRLKITGEGEAGYHGSAVGDLYIRINVRPHPEFTRRGFDIISEVPVSFYHAALGAKIEVETVDGAVELKIPSGIQSGKILRLRGKGVPHYSGNGRGDHLVVVRVVTPQKLSRAEKELFKKLAGESGESVEVSKSLWDKLRESF